MRRLIVAAAAAVALVAAVSFAGGRAEAMPLPGAGGLGAAAQTHLVQDVRYVCRPVWNGWRWVQRCFWVRPRPYFYGGPPVRPYPYGYYRHRPRPYIY